MADRASRAAEAQGEGLTEALLEQWMHECGLIGVAGDNPRLEAQLLAYAEKVAAHLRAAGKAKPVIVSSDKPYIADGKCAFCGGAAGKCGGGEAERHREIGAAVERACAELTEGFDLHIELERDAGTVTLYMPDTDASESEFESDTFGGQINKAIDAAIAAKAKAEEQQG